MKFLKIGNMRDYTDKEFFEISREPYNKKLLKHKYSSATVDYLVGYLPLEEVKKIIKKIIPEYNRIWEVCNADDKVPIWSEVLNLIEKEYGTYKRNN